jgi:hypothetical protein
VPALRQAQGEAVVLKGHTGPVQTAGPISTISQRFKSSSDSSSTVSPTFLPINA